jgi:TonB family protein
MDRGRPQWIYASLISILIHLLFVPVILQFETAAPPIPSKFQVTLIADKPAYPTLNKVLIQKPANLPKKEKGPTLPSPTRNVSITKDEPSFKNPSHDLSINGVSDDMMPTEQNAIQSTGESSGQSLRVEDVSGQEGQSGGSVNGTPEGTDSVIYTPLIHVTQMPVLKTRVVPIYPEEAKQKEREGKVILDVSLSQTGEVIHIVVVKPAGFGFDEAAIVAIKQSDFDPAFVGDQPVSVIIRVPIQFRFRD